MRIIHGHFTTLIISGFYISDFENAFFGISIAQLYKSLQLLYLGIPHSSSTKRRASQANIQFHCLHPPVVCLCVERLRKHVEKRSVKRAKARALNALFCIHFECCWFSCFVLYKNNRWSRFKCYVKRKECAVSNMADKKALQNAASVHTSKQKHLATANTIQMLTKWRLIIGFDFLLLLS